MHYHAEDNQAQLKSPLYVMEQQWWKAFCKNINYVILTVDEVIFYTRDTC